MELLERVIERAKQARSLQKTAYEKYITQIGEQVDFLQNSGVTCMSIRIPEILNGIPINRTRVYKKVYRTLRRLGYSIEPMENLGMKISWYML